MAKKSKKAKRISTCFICNSPKNSHSIVLTRNNENPKYKYPDGKIRKVLLRCESCAPGSPIWMISEVGMRSSNRKYFECLYSNDPTILLTSSSNRSRKSEPIKERSEPEPTSDDSKVSIISQLNSAKDKKAKARLRRQLRKQGVYVSKIK